MEMPTKLPSMSSAKAFLNSTLSNGYDYNKLKNIAQSAILTNRFVACVNYPDIVSKIDNKINGVSNVISYKDLSERIKTVNLPSYNLETDSYTRGMFEKFVGTKRSLGDLSITFYENNYYSVRHLFEKWIDSCFSVETTTTSQAGYSITRRYVEEYTGTFTFHPLDFKGTENSMNNESNLQKIEYQIFPFQISEVTYDNTSDNNIGEITVAFKCKLAIGKY